MIKNYYVMAFLEAIYPGASELVAASFNEKAALEDATALINELRAERDALKAEVGELIRNRDSAAEKIIGLGFDKIHLKDRAEKAEAEGESLTEALDIAAKAYAKLKNRAEKAEAKLEKAHRRIDQVESWLEDMGFKAGEAEAK